MPLSRSEARRLCARAAAYVSLLQVLLSQSSSVSSYYYICVLILLYICPHTATYVSSYCYICVLCVLVQVLCQLISAEVARILAREADFRCTEKKMYIKK